MNFTIHQGDNRDILKTIPDNSVDAIVTDPPYGIDFLGKAWDANTGALETYSECLRVLKPGGYILAFSAARTYHHLAVTLEQAGFEIRDQLMWLYASGFPKAQDIGKAIQKRIGVEKTNTHNTLNGYAKEQTAHGAQRVGDVSKDDYDNTIKETVCTSPEAQLWEGWKTALKPAHEPVAMARKPFKGSTIDNVLAHGVGALNIDATRIETQDKIQSHYNRNSGAPEYQGETKNIVDVVLEPLLNINNLCDVHCLGKIIWEKITKWSKKTKSTQIY
jgi:site-specific DNA-methyltransferase (adenine-specific)